MKILHALTIGILFPFSLHGMWSFTVLAGLYTAYNKRKPAPITILAEDRLEIITHYANVQDKCLRLSGCAGTGKMNLANYIAQLHDYAEKHKNEHNGSLANA